MAEVKDAIPATAQKFDNKGGLVRRNSTGNFNSQPTTSKVLPHYLQASTGSCHDLCKSGSVPHVVEAKERTHFTERYAKTVDKTQYQAKNFRNTNLRKKKTVLKIQAPYKCEVIMEEKDPTSTKKETCASDLKLKPVKTKVISVTKPSRLSIHYTEFILPKNLGVIQASSNNKRISEGESKTVKETKTSSKTPKASMKRSSTMTNLTSLSAPKPLRRKISEIVMPKVEKNPGNISNSETEMIKKNSDCPSQRSPLREVLTEKFAEGDEPQKDFPLNEENGADLAETKESVIPEKIFFIPDPEAENNSLTCHSPPYVDQNDLTATSSDIGNNDVTDATQLRIERREEINADKETCKAESPQSTLCSPDCSDKINHIEQEQKPRRLKRVVSEKNLSSLQKVKFGQGKEVNPQIDDSSPRKAKFREGSVLENQNGKAENRGRGLRRLVSDVVSDKVKTGYVKKVDLRHQEVKGRRTSSCSFNNVIEETASKLAESRKSKVKALVGAFETVISLQD